MDKIEAKPLKEKIYDEQIGPHIRAIRQVCIDNKIPMVFSVYLYSESPPKEIEDIYSFTVIVGGDDYPPPEHMFKAWNLLKPVEYQLSQVYHLP